MIPKECLIIGGGSSISEGLSLGLKEKIQDKFVVTINFASYHFNSTFTTCMDNSFYKGKLLSDSKEINQDHINHLKSLPLIIAPNAHIRETPYNNTILTKKIKAGALTGIYALYLISYLLDYNGIIYLLGFDWSRRTKEEKEKNILAKTHYYDEIKHKGIGLSKYYENHKGEDFKPFLNYKNLKIYNVNPNSNLDYFEKIYYNKMFELLNKEKYNQEELRKEIKIKLQDQSNRKE